MSDSPPALKSSERRKILVVEDEAIQILLVKSQLESRGFQVISAMDGEEGLRRARAEQPDLVLMDVVLPGADGIQICTQLKEAPETQHIPVILVTASGMKNLEERCKIFGVDACLIKPYQLDELFGKIEGVLQNRSPGRADALRG